MHRTTTIDIGILLCIIIMSIFPSVRHVPVLFQGLTENDGHENDGPSKLQGMKLQDMKMTDQVAGHKIAGHENTGHENARHHELFQ